MVTMDIGKMVPRCWTPLQVFSCRKITKSSSPSQPTGPLSHQVPQRAQIVALVTCNVVNVIIGVWHMLGWPGLLDQALGWAEPEPRRRESLGHAGKGQSCWAKVQGGTKVRLT